VRYELVSGKEYPVYSQKEADELGLSYKHPFEVSEGEYGISIDGEVAICLKRSSTKNKRGYINVKYPWGPSFIKSTKCKVISEGRLNNYNINGKNDRGKFIKKKDDYIKLAHLMAQPGMRKDAAIKMVFGSVPNNKKYSIRKTMRTEVFRKMTKDELTTIIEEFPIGKMDTARALAAVLDKVMDWDGDSMGSKGDPKVAMTVLDRLMDMNEMKSKGKIITTQQIEASTTESTLADIQEKKKMFKATQTEVTDGISERPEQEKEEE